jgi:tRNA A-37 threonylcarbamoyl transferase component Bud32
MDPQEQPKFIGKYEIVTKLGLGATSTVYLAYDPFAGRMVAIKVMKPEILKDTKTGPIHRKQLLNEASLAGKLSHPHIIQIYDAVVEGEDCYVVMEFVSGGTLEKYTEPGNLLPMSRVIEHMFKCCRALNYAQFNGVIHRDIKPANMLLTEEGEIKISDMGAAIVLTNADQTQINDIGSPVYMSPEQIGGELLTHQTDIYSLGVVMYSLLTGRLPYTAKNLTGLFYQILNAQYPTPRSLRPEIPEALEQIVLRAMQKSKADRYQDWKEFGNDLAAVGHIAGVSHEGEGQGDAEKFTVLREMEMFKEFTDTELWEILRIGEWTQHPAKTILLREDEFGDDFYILIEGTVGVTKGPRLLNVIQKGDTFGEMAYISGKAMPRSATITANSDVTVMRISPQLLVKTSDHCQLSFNMAFLRTLADRLRQVDDRFSKVVVAS